MAIKDFKFSTEYTLNKQGRISTKGNVRLIKECTRLSERFESVGGWFNCGNNALLTSLAGAPQSVGGDFYCYNNKLTSLAGAPQSVGGDFYCYNNKLTSLAGAPQSVGGYFACYNNELTSLAGAPQSVGGVFACYNNELTSLSGAPQSVGGRFLCDWIKDLPMLNLLQYKKVRIYENNLVNDIFQKYCGNYNKQNVMGCIRELHAAGLAMNARFY